MTNDELKKKIANIIDNVFENRCRKTNCKNCDLYLDEMCQPNMYADALIAAGIGDVKDVEAEANRYEMLYKLQNRDMALAERRAHDAEHRAARAEIALLYAVSEYRCDECPCEECNAEISGSNECIDLIIKTYKEQAEKELAEERK